MNWKDLEETLKGYVTRVEFNARLSPIEKIVWGIAIAFAAGIVAALLRVILKQ